MLIEKNQDTWNLNKRLPMTLNSTMSRFIMRSTQQNETALKITQDTLSWVSCSFSKNAALTWHLGVALYADY